MSDEGGSVQFTVQDEDGFYVTVSEQLTVYESKSDAVDDIQEILDEDDEAFIAEVSIEGQGSDVNVNLEQVAWQQIIKEMASE